MLTVRDVKRLTGVHPDLIAAVQRVADDMDDRFMPMFVVQGVRTQLEQARLYAQGRTKIGPNVRPGHPLGDVVTMKDGVRFTSNHQPHADGLGHAVDLAFVPTMERKDPFDAHWPWETFGTLAEAQNLRWGGRWSHPHDAPHVEL